MNFRRKGCKKAIVEIMAILIFTLPVLRSKHKDAKIFENHLNPLILVFIGKLLLSNHRFQ